MRPNTSSSTAHSSVGNGDPPVATIVPPPEPEPPPAPELTRTVAVVARIGVVVEPDTVVVPEPVVVVVAPAPVVVVTPTVVDVVADLEDAVELVLLVGRHVTPLTGRRLIQRRRVRRQSVDDLPQLGRGLAAQIVKGEEIGGHSAVLVSERAQRR